jgi:hypothetical protein
VTSFEATWTVLNIQKPAIPNTCCSNCNPALLQQQRFQPVLLDNARLYTFGGDFLFPVMQTPARPSSRASNTSNISATSHTSFQPVRGSFVVSKDSKESLRDALGRWCQRRHEQQGSSLLISRKIGLPPKQTDKLVSSAATFMCMHDVTADAILKIVKLDLLSPAEVCKVEKVIHDW